MIFAPWLLSLLLVLAVIGSLAGLVLGAWIFLNPNANALLDRSAVDALRPLSRPVRVERFVYRHHRWFGGGIVVGSFCTLVALGGYLRRMITLAGLNGLRGVDAWLWESLLLFVALGNFFTLAAGVLILIRPSGLKGFEAWANRRVDFKLWRQSILAAIRRRPRLFALLLAAGGAFSLISLWLKWWRG
ncbi:MAG: hypothetical protein HQL91_00965 [Magnetococcales bacterium]|nr:hypothetical protein [Magnetococcales bacterium]